MQKIVGVRFRDCGKLYYFSPGELELVPNDKVIVETIRGLEFAFVTSQPAEIEEEKVVKPLKTVVRKATAEDVAQLDQNRAREADAFSACQKKIEERGLPMRLVDVDFGFTGGRVTFYFTAEDRVDFRELVKDLATVFHTRIELRQIGVRDEAKMLGGLGACGRSVCCASFLSDFQPVSIKMAKEQNLALSPPKISGICGRLMCCLKYEQECYEEMRKRMPRIGRRVTTADGNGIVIDNNILTEKTKVKVMLNDGTFDMREYHFSEIILEKGTSVKEVADEVKDDEALFSDAVE
ncbi:MAG: stage 0 sporulation family protein [Clostridia bacterium]